MADWFFLYGNDAKFCWDPENRQNAVALGKL